PLQLSVVHGLSSSQSALVLQDSGSIMVVVVVVEVEVVVATQAAPVHVPGPDKGAGEGAMSQGVKSASPGAPASSTSWPIPSGLPATWNGPQGSSHQLHSASTGPTWAPAPTYRPPPNGPPEPTKLTMLFRWITTPEFGVFGGSSSSVMRMPQPAPVLRSLP